MAVEAAAVPSLPAQAAAGPSLVEQIWVVAHRSIARTLRQRALLVFPVLFPLILFAINGSALGAATKIRGFPTDSYRDFALALPFIQGALFVSIAAGVDIARDIETGFFNRLALTPLRGAALLLGQLGGAFVVACMQSVVYLLVGIATGVGIVALGLVADAHFRPGRARSGDLVICVGVPKSAPHHRVVAAENAREGHGREQAAARQCRASSRCCS